MISVAGIRMIIKPAIRTALFIAAAFAATPVVPQSGTSEAELRLTLQLSKVNQQRAGEQYAQKLALFQQGLASKEELRNAEAEVERTRLETQRATVSLSNQLPSFRILSAVKSIARDGTLWIDLALQELRSDSGIDHRSYLVSLKGPTSIIAEPYEQQVSVTGIHSTPLHLKFRLLRDVDELTVLVVSGTRREETPILLQRSKSANALSMTASNYSQEGALGEKVDYALQIERFSPTIEDLDITVAGLPSDVTYECIDADTKARINRIRFAKDQNTRRIVLRVFVPEVAKADWFQKTTTFHVQAITNGGATGTTDLQLRPVGSPKLTISSDQLLVRTHPGETVRVPIAVENTGGAAARDVVMDATFPIGVHGSFEPATVPEIVSRASRRVDMLLNVASDATAGDYTFKVQALAKNRLTDVDSPEQSFRVAVELATPVLMTIVASGGLGALAIAGGIYAFRRKRA